MAFEEAAPQPEGAPAPEAQQNPEDAIVDQIGELMKQLAPEKQAQVLAALQEQAGAAEQGPEPIGTESAMGGAKGMPHPMSGA